MRKFIASAPVGDDVYGEDPTVNSLEERVAELFGHEAALFCPTGSLANQLAIRMLVAPGEELLTETNSHIVRAELGAGAVFSGITTRTWLAERGLLRAEDALEIAKPDSGPYLVSTTAIAIENTHNFGGGTVQPIEEIKKLRNETQISTKERVQKARQWRKRYGGGMRQVGIIAAAGHFALDNNIKFLNKDHERAKSIATAASKVSLKVIDPKNVDTNIVGLDLSSMAITAPELATQLKEFGILTGPLGSKYLRLVTHMDLTDADIEIVNKVLPDLLDRALKSK